MSIATKSVIPVGCCANCYIVDEVRYIGKPSARGRLSLFFVYFCK